MLLFAVRAPTAVPARRRKSVSSHTRRLVSPAHEARATIALQLDAKKSTDNHWYIRPKASRKLSNLIPKLSYTGWTAQRLSHVCPATIVRALFDESFSIHVKEIRKKPLFNTSLRYLECRILQPVQSALTIVTYNDMSPSDISNPYSR
jgi:hypothetical protein